jgi:hypothetical protein
MLAPKATGCFVARCFCLYLFPRRLVSPAHARWSRAVQRAYSIERSSDQWGGANQHCNLAAPVAAGDKSRYSTPALERVFLGSVLLAD